MFKKQFFYALLFCASSLSCMDLTPFPIKNLLPEISNTIIDTIIKDGDLLDILHFGSTCKEQYEKHSTKALLLFNPKIVIKKMNDEQFRTALIVNLYTMTQDERKTIIYERLYQLEKKKYCISHEVINLDGSCKYTTTELFKKRCFHYNDNVLPQLKRLLEQGADVNSIVSPAYQHTALMHFITFNHYNTTHQSSRDAIALLLEYNANPNTYSVYGESPLSMCKKIKDEKYAETLKKQLIAALAREDFDK